MTYLAWYNTPSKLNLYGISLSLIAKKHINGYSGI